ncbi:MAG: histidine phosphatase family protein [Clostridia bacterium]|nr:histidine phosphatase family protein [Clostridia bacterium]
MSIKIVYFVHGTTTDNELHKAAGWNEVDLSEKGIEQSKALRDKINIDEIDFVISSDLKRAIHSANNIFENDKEIIVDKRLRECNYGDFNGDDSSKVIYEEHIEDKFPNGECLKDVESRMRNICNELLEKYDGKTIAFVAHKAPQLALDVITKNMTWEDAINNDWRKTKAWQPGWTYELK